MARRTSNKIEPAALTVFVATSITGGGTAAAVNYLDLSQVTSLLNRRFYRQGLNWAVAGFKAYTASSYAGQIQISKLPNTWVMSNAWEKSFRAWNKMNREALAESDSVRPRFLDFKVYADSDHHNAGFGANLLPISQAGGFIAGEWESSKVFVPEAYNNVPASGTDTMNTLELVATGGNYPGAGASGHDAVSLIEGYAAGRALPNILDPNTPDDAADVASTTPENWLAAIFNEGTTQDADVIDELTTENNIAPYPFENDGVNLDTMYPGGANQGPGLEVHDIGFVSATTIGGTTRLKGGNFPCGLIRIETLNDPSAEVSSVLLQVDLIPGNHRGYLCEPMTEM